MSRIITGTTTTGIVLTSTTDNPVTVTGRISVASGIALKGTPGSANTWTVNNYGTIISTAHGTGLFLGTYTSSAASGTVVNESTGLINGSGYGVFINAGTGASVTNNAGGTIIGSSYKAIYISGGLGTVVNAGLLQAGNVGVYEDLGGTVTNLSTGTITGNGGVWFQKAGTLTNAGTIASTSSGRGAVIFNSDTVSSRLIVDPGAVFGGKIQSLTGSTNVIELASSANVGTLSGFDGTNITNFQTLQFDTGAKWTVSGNSLATGFGSIAIAGFAANDTIDLTGFIAVSDTFGSNAVTFTNAGNLHATLHIQGTFSSSNLQFSGDGSTGTDIFLGTVASKLLYGQTINEAGILATSETVTAGVMTLRNAGSTIVGTIAVGVSLSSGEFMLRPDGSGGTEVILDTVFGTYATGVTLLTNPTTIASTGMVSDTVASGIGIKGPTGTSWTVANQGIVSEAGAGSIGISLASTGTITNAAGGRITGAQEGVSLVGGGLVSAQAGGTMSGITGIVASGSTATLVNAGSISGNLTSGAGISLFAGGSVTNVAGSTISGSYGVVAASVAATVVNAGSIGDGTALPTGAAIALKKGGLITNQTNGQIIAGLQAIYGGGAALTMVNAGTIGGGPTTGNGIIIVAGGLITNQSSGLITGKYGVHAVASAATMVNYGSIGGALTVAGGAGVFFSAGGVVTNQSGGTITGLRGIAATGGTVVNTGSIGGNATTSSGAGVQLISGASLSNQSGGIITGFTGVYGKATAATLVNAGSIGGNTVSGSGVLLVTSGSVTNQSGGAITGFNGILTTGGATVVNAGSISGTTAVSLGAGAANRLTVDPGAVFSGTVNGGNTIGAAAISTLELASGASAGTLTGLGTQIINFAHGTIDASATWIFSAANSLVAGATLLNSGALIDTGTLINSGTLTGNQISLSGGALTNRAGGVLTTAYIYGVAASGTDTILNQGIINASVILHDLGIVTNTATIVATGTASGVTIGGTGIVSNLNPAGLIAGYVGVQLASGGTIVNAGTIASNQGPGGVAVAFGTGTNRLIDAPGAVFTGAIYGGVGATSVIELASAASAGTIAGFGGTITNFTSLVFDPGALWTVSGNDSASGLGTLAISGFTLGDTIELTGFVAVSETFASNTLVLTDASSAHATLAIQGAFLSSNFHIASSGLGDTDVTLQIASPVISGTVGGQTTSDNATINPFTAFAMTDPNVSQTETVTVTFSDPLNGALSNASAGTYNATTGVYSVTGVIADVASALNGLVFTPTAHQVAPASTVTTTFTINATDTAGGTSRDTTTTVIATAANDAPVIAGALGNQAGTDEAPLTPFSTVSINDVDFGQTEMVTVTLSNHLNGVLSGATGGTYDALTGIYSKTGNDSTVTAALRELIFTPAAHQVAPGGSVTTTFTIATTDTAGATASDATTTVMATAAHDDPVIVGALASQLITDEATLTPFAGVSVSDVDFGQTETVTVTLSDPLNGALSNGGGAYDATTGVYSITGSDNAVTAALASLVFTPTAHQVVPDDSVTTTFTIATTDTAGDTASDSTTTVTATATHDDPVITGALGSQTVTDEATLTPFAGVSVSDVDFGQTETVTVALSDPLNGALLGPDGTYDAAAGVYSVTGSDDAVTAALAGLVFTPTIHQVAPGSSVTTTFNIDATDTAGDTSSDATTTVIATAANDAPVIAGASGNQSVTDEMTLTPFSNVSVSDVDFGQTEAVTITLSDPLNGTFSGLDGTYDDASGVYSTTGSDDAVTAALARLVFTPTAHQVAPGSSVTTTFTIDAIDTAGGTSSDATTTVAATAMNDALVISGTLGNQTVTDEATLTPFVGVAISDVDFGQTETVTVTLSNPLNGALSHLVGGTYDATTGVYTKTGSDSEVTAALNELKFTPTAHQVAPGNPVNTTFTIDATDTAGDTSSDTTTTVAATAVNDEPVIAGVLAGQTVTDETTLTPFATASVSDVDFGQTETVTVTLSEPLNGALSNLANGTYDAITGVYSVTGEDGAVTAALAGLAFTPTIHQVAPGSSVTTTFTIDATDTAGATSSDATTTVAATAVNDPPAITNVAVNVGVPNQSNATPFAGLTITDPSFGHIDTVTVTLSNPTGGTLANLGGGSYDAASGIYTDTGTPSDITAALQGLTFSAAPPPAGSFVSTTGFTVVATGPGGSVSNTSISVTSSQQVLGLGDTSSGTAVVSPSLDGTTFATPTLGATNEAVITAPVSGASYTLPTSYQAVFLGGTADATLTDPSAGNALLVGNSGNDTLISGAGNDTILAGSGLSTIQFTAGASGGVAFGGVGSVMFLDAGSNDTLAGGSGTTTATTSGASAVFFSLLGNATVVNSGTNTTLVGGSEQSTFQLTAGATGAVVFGGTGSVAIVDAGSNDTLAGASGATAVITAGSSAVFFGAGGDATVVNSGSNTTLVGGSGQSTFQLTSQATSAVVFGGLSTATIADAGSNDTIAGAGGATAVTTAGSSAVFFGQAGASTVLDTGLGDTIVGGAGVTAVTANGSGAVVFGGSGSLNFVGGASGATIAGGSGRASISGGSGGTTLFGGSGGEIHYTGTVGGLLYAAQSGNETLDASGSTTSNRMFGGLDSTGRDLIVGGSGNDTLAAGSGSDTLTGGLASHDLFVFFSVNGSASAHDMVVNFTPNDHVLLSGYGATAAATALKSATSSGGATTITLSDNTEITFSSISSVTGLTEHIFSV